MEAIQSRVSEHKLTSIGALWASGIGASLAYNRGSRSPLKPSLRLIHARLHAQALTLAVLSSAAIYHCNKKLVGDKAETVASPSMATAAAVQAERERNIDSNKLFCSRGSR